MRLYKYCIPFEPKKELIKPAVGYFYIDKEQEEYLCSHKFLYVDEKLSVFFDRYTPIINCRKSLRFAELMSRKLVCLRYFDTDSIKVNGYIQDKRRKIVQFSCYNSLIIEDTGEPFATNELVEDKEHDLCFFITNEHFSTTALSSIFYIFRRFKCFDLSMMR